jgi:hypothetical protein
MLFVSFITPESRQVLQFRGSNWIGSTSGEPTYRDSGFHSRQADHSRDREAISALLKTALILSSETRVERCNPSVLFSSPFLF